MPESNEEFTQIINEFRALKPGSYVGLDTETTGLDYNKDQVVGVCVARLDDTHKYVGYYLPVRHSTQDCNLPAHRVFGFTNWLIKRFRCVLFNRSYDFSMLEREEEVNITTFNHDDCQILCWESRYDKFPSLKKFYRTYCKKDIESFAETMKSSRKSEDSLDEIDENSHNFGETDPRYSYPYGAYDPVATLELFFTIMRLFPYTRVIYPLDNKLGEVIRRFTKQEFHVDYDEVRRQLEEEQAKLRQYQREVYEIAGYQFNIKSSREKAEALSRVVTLTVKTKKGAFKVDEEVLKEIDHPLAEAILRWTETFTFVNNTLTKLLTIEGTPFRINYKTCEAPCLTKESTVLIKGKGVISVADVKQGDEIMSERGWTRVTEVSSHLCDKLVRVEVKGSPSFTATKWHPVWDLYTIDKDGNWKGRWVHAEDLEKSKQLLPWVVDFDESSEEQVEIKTRTGKFKITLNDEWAQIIGYLDGDGSLLEDRVKLCFSPYDSEEFISYYAQLMQRLTGLEPHRSLSGGAIQVAFFCADLSKYLKSIGVRQGSIPAFIKQSQVRIARYFAGMWDSDGTLSKCKDYYKITCSGVKPNIEEMHRLAQYLGLRTSLRRESNDRVQVKNVLEVWQSSKLNFYKVRKWMKHPLKCQRYDLGPWKEGATRVRVVSVLPAPADVIYNISTETETYLADTIVHHNTGRLATGRSRGNTFYSEINISAMPSDAEMLYVHKLDGPIPFIANREKEGALGLVECKAGVRTAFTAPEGYVFVTADFCLPLDTNILTPQGVVKLKDLKVGDVVETPYGSKRVYNKTRVTEHPQVEIELSSGERLVCSPEHKIAALQGFKVKYVEAKDLTDYDIVWTKAFGSPNAFNKIKVWTTQLLKRLKTNFGIST